MTFRIVAGQDMQVFCLCLPTNVYTCNLEILSKAALKNIKQNLVCVCIVNKSVFCCCIVKLKTLFVCQ